MIHLMGALMDKIFARTHSSKGEIPSVDGTCNAASSYYIHTYVYSAYLC